MGIGVGEVLIGHGQRINKPMNQAKDEVEAFGGVHLWLRLALLVGLGWTVDFSYPVSQRAQAT